MLFMFVDHAGCWAGSVCNALLFHWDRQSAGQRSRGLYGRSLLRARWQTDTRGQYSKHFHKSSGFHSMCLYLPLTEHACSSSKAVFVHWVVLNSFLKQSMHQFMHRAVPHHSSAFACASHMMCDIWGGTHFAAPAVRPLWPLWLGDK